MIGVGTEIGNTSRSYSQIDEKENYLFNKRGKFVKHSIKWIDPFHYKKPTWKLVISLETGEKATVEAKGNTDYVNGKKLSFSESLDLRKYLANLWNVGYKR